MLGVPGYKKGKGLSGVLAPALIVLQGDTLQLPIISVPSRYPSESGNLTNVNHSPSSELLIKVRLQNYILKTAESTF